MAGVVDGAAPNAPREDVARIAAGLEDLGPEVIVSFGGGSTIDAVKAAEVLRTLGGDIDDYFGTGLVTPALRRPGKKLTPHVAIQTAASSSGASDQVLQHHRPCRRARRSSSWTRPSCRRGRFSTTG